MRVLALLPLRRLPLLLNANWINPIPGRRVGRPAPAQPDPPLPYHEVERSLAEFDISIFMTQLTDAITTSNNVIVTMYGPRGDERQREIELEGGRYLAL